MEKHAKGNRPQAARSLTATEEDLLFEAKQFGDHDPEGLQRILCILVLELVTSQEN